MNPKDKKNNDSKKKIDIKVFEEQAYEIINSNDVAELDNIEIPEDIINRLKKADITELAVIEQEFGISHEIHEKMDEENNKILPEESSIDIPDNEHKRTDKSVDKASGDMMVDSSCKITLSKDRMNAQIDLYPSKGGGVPLTISKIEKELEAAGVVYGVNYDLLKKLILNSEKTKEQKLGVIIAQGNPSVEGRDGVIEYLFSDDESVIRLSEEKNNSS
jgi:hypothetical protein